MYHVGTITTEGKGKKGKRGGKGGDGPVRLSDEGPKITFCHIQLQWARVPFQRARPQNNVQVEAASVETSEGCSIR